MRLILLLLLPCLTLAQSDWEEISLDNHVSFSIPAGYQRIDTAKQEGFYVRGDFGNIQMIKIPQSGGLIRNEKELIQFYKGFQKTTVEPWGVDIYADSTIKIGEVYARTFDFEININDSLYVQENKALMIERHIYYFSYMYFKPDRLIARREKDKFFAGISAPFVDVDDQFTIPKKEELWGMKIGYVLRYVILGALLLMGVFWLQKQYRYANLIKKIVSGVCLVLGAFNLLIYVGNLFYGIYHTRILVMGCIFALVGYGLRKIKVPIAKS